jgi:DNA-binding NarL/FixJ family response regulator
MLAEPRMEDRATITRQATELAALAAGGGRVPPDFRARVASTLTGLCALVADSSRVAGAACPATCAHPEPGTSRRSRDWGRRPPGLAPRPWQVLCELQDGCSEKEVAGRLGLSVHTVHCYVTRLYRHYGVGSRAELLSLWVRKGGRPAERSRVRQPVCRTPVKASTSASMALAG